MGLFTKSKSEEFDDEEGFTEKEGLGDRRLTRKFRDLKPENKKRRKEPPKPWGKRERLVVLGFFIVTPLLAALMLLFSSDLKFPNLPKISFSEFNIKNPFGEEIVEIGQKGVASKNDEKSEKAVSLFQNEIKPLSGLYGFEVIRLDTGEKYGVSSGSNFQGASLLKLPLMILMYKMSEAGSLNLDTKYILKDSDKIKGSGVLYTAKSGTVYTYRELAEYMGKDSDRTAYKVIKEVIGDNNLQTFIKSIGMNSTNINTGDTTPSDMAGLLQKLWNGDLVNQGDRNEILGYLTNTIYENWIAAGVPKNVRVAHKFGQDEAVMADGGIVETDHPYILVIMGNGITQHDADTLFPKVSKDVYNVENNIQ